MNRCVYDIVQNPGNYLKKGGGQDNHAQKVLTTDGICITTVALFADSITTVALFADIKQNKREIARI